MSTVEQAEEQREGMQEQKGMGFQQATFLALGGICITGMLYTQREHLNAEVLEKAKSLVNKSLRDMSSVFTVTALSIWFAAIYDSFKTNSILQRTVFAGLMTSYHGWSNKCIIPFGP